MPKFEVVLQRTITELMNVTVTAKDEDDAEEKVKKIMGQCEHAADKIAAHFKEEWSIDDEEFDIDNVIEL